MRSMYCKFLPISLFLLTTGILYSCTAAPKQTKPEEISLSLTVAEETKPTAISKETSPSQRIRAAAWNEKTELPEKLSDLAEYSAEESSQVIYEFLMRYARENTELKLLLGEGNYYWDEGKSLTVFEAPGECFVAGNILYLPAGNEETTVMICNSRGDVLWNSGVLSEGNEFFFSLSELPADTYTIYWESTVSVTTQEDIIKAPLLISHFFTVPESMEKEFGGGITFQ